MKGRVRARAILESLLRPCRVCKRDVLSLLHFGFSEDGIAAHEYVGGEA